MNVQTSVDVINEVSAQVPLTAFNFVASPIEPILYEPTFWETLTTFIQNVINLI